MKCVVAALAVLALLSGAIAEDDAKCTPLTEVAAGNTILLEAAQAAGLVELLTKDDAAFTIFAPTDEAFKELLKKLKLTKDQLFAQTALLKEVLTYHVLPNPVKAAEFVAGTEYKTALDGSCEATLTVSADGDKTVIEGALTKANVVTADVEACAKTIVHVIDVILIPCDPAAASGGKIGGSGGTPAADAKSEGEPAASALGGSDGKPQKEAKSEGKPAGSALGGSEGKPQKEAKSEGEPAGSALGGSDGN